MRCASTFHGHCGQWPRRMSVVQKTKSLISMNHYLNYSMMQLLFGQSLGTYFVRHHFVARRNLSMLIFICLFFSLAETEEAAAAAAAATTEASADALSANDIQSSGSATPSPNSDNDRHIDRMPRIKSIEKINAIDSLRQLQEIDVERNIPAAYIQDTNNVNADR